MFLLPFKISDGTENMQADLSMLCDWQDYPDLPRLRFYGWKGEWFSCGMSQDEQSVRRAIAPSANLVKRPTGGGIVDHRNDITYALVVGRNHKLSETKAGESYKTVHTLIAEALNELGFDANVLQSQAQAHGKIYACFDNPAQFDTVLAGGVKVAGAAQKRNKFGILFQGSIDYSKLGPVSKEDVREAVAEKFSALLGKIENI